MPWPLDKAVTIITGDYSSKAKHVNVGVTHNECVFKSAIFAKRTLRKYYIMRLLIKLLTIKIEARFLPDCSGLQEREPSLHEEDENPEGDQEEGVHALHKLVKVVALIRAVHLHRRPILLQGDI